VLQPSKRPNGATFGCLDGWSHWWRRSDRGLHACTIQASWECSRLQAASTQDFSRSRIAPLSDTGVRSGSHGTDLQIGPLEALGSVQLRKDTTSPVAAKDTASQQGPQATRLKTVNGVLSTPRYGCCRLSFAYGGGCDGEKHESCELPWRSQWPQRSTRVLMNWSGLRATYNTAENINY